MTQTHKKPHKNKNRALIKPLDAPTLALTVFGLGFLRPAPGSWGSLPPVVLMLAISLLGGSMTATAGVIVFMLLTHSVACVVFGRYAETRFALPDGTPQKDAPEVVADETAGMSVALLAIPIELALLSSTDNGSSWVPSFFLEPPALLAMAFVFFRAADTLKPWPARALEKLPHGWGVLLDDLAAGIYAGLAHGVVYYIATL